MVHRIRRRLIKFMYQPIRIFCFHQVSDSFDGSTMYEEDWLQNDEFKLIIGRLRKHGYTFLSMEEAYKRLKTDIFRHNKYAVLTADDGWASIKNILPWLNEQRIPVTLFLTPAYFDGSHYRDRNTEKYLSEADVKQLHARYPLLTVGSHGWKHVAATEQTDEEFENDIKASVNELSRLPNYVPFFAYAWGKHNESTDKILRDNRLVQVNTEGGMNYNVCNPIDREILASDMLL